MKKSITEKQVEELSNIVRVRYLEWQFGITKEEMASGLSFTLDDLVDRQGCPFANIGQMIEFLDKHDGVGLGIIMVSYSAEEFCDALWELIKKILNETKKT